MNWILVGMYGCLAILIVLIVLQYVRITKVRRAYTALMEGIEQRPIAANENIDSDNAYWSQVIRNAIDQF